MSRATVRPASDRTVQRRRDPAGIPGNHEETEIVPGYACVNCMLSESIFLRWIRGGSEVVRTISF